MSSYPDYVVIGHITRDLYNGGHKIGGTATFSALTARAMGYRVGIVTSAGSEIDASPLPTDIDIVVRAAEATTTFENFYEDGHRSQFIWSQANLLTSKDVPLAWSGSPIVHLGPVAQEVDPGLIDCFADSLLGLTPQGWMRGWDKTGKVHPLEWRPAEALPRRADALILSQEDVGGDMALVRAYASRTRLLVVTTGWEGATVYHGEEVRVFPAPQVHEQDPTGAGDIFATALLTALHETRDPWLSAQYANCVASHSVERSGLASIPTVDEIEQCRKRYRMRTRAQ